MPTETKKKKRVLSQTPGAIFKRWQTVKAREERERLAELEEDGGDGGGQDGEVNTGSIGVQSPAKPTPQLYHCENCDEDVTKGMSHCPTCEINLNWPE